MLPFQIARRRTPYFARWAKMTKPFIGEKHTLEGKKICYSIQKEKEYANHLEMAGFYAALSSAMELIRAATCGSCAMLRSPPCVCIRI